MAINSVAIEFYAFIALAAWVVYSQWRGSTRREDGESDTAASKPESADHGEGPPGT